MFPFCSRPRIQNICGADFPEHMLPREKSRRERLEAAGRRGVELGPVDLLLEAMIGFIADRAFAAQALERLALVLDRAQPQLVVLGRGLWIVRLLRHSAGSSLLLAHGCCCGRPISPA